MPSYLVLGAGHGGLAVAGQIGLNGFPVRLWARNPESLIGVAVRRGVRLEGSVTGFGRVTACPDLRQALDGVDVVLVALPASAHGEIARRCAPFLTDGQKILLLPGRTAGAVEFSAELRRAECRADVLVGEAQTFPYACRRTGPAEATIHGVKRQVLAAALPACRTPELLAAVRPALPQFTPARWVWKTSLDNIGAIFHPAVALLNAGRIESTGGAFRHYVDGISPSVAGLLERLDAERVGVAKALGVAALSAREWLADAYGVERPSLYEAIQATPAYAGVGAPATLDHRYLWEDVPTGLVPIAALGSACSVATPTIDSVVDLASAACARDFRAGGRTLERLGLTGRTPDEIGRFALCGEQNTTEDEEVAEVA